MTNEALYQQNPATFTLLLFYCEREEEETERGAGREELSILVSIRLVIWSSDGINQFKKKMKVSVTELWS